VFITNEDSGEILEYAHGGRKPIAELNAGLSSTVGCAIDPTTGNLAVSTFEGVAIFTNARGTPTTYTDPDFSEYFLCSYDDKGDLFVDGLTSNDAFIFAELPKDHKRFKYILLVPTIEFPGGVQWDGKYVAVGDQDVPVIYRYKVSGGMGTGVGKTSLGSDADEVFQFFILGNRVIAPSVCVYPCIGDVFYYHWPEGGSSTRTITDGIRYPRGVVVSFRTSS
jgi:hypothetical protein